MTHKSRTDRRTVFKLGSKAGHVTRHTQQLFKVKRSKVKVTVTWRVSRQKRYNSAVYGHINFKLGGNDRRGSQRVWYNFNVSRSNKPEVEIWRTFKILNAKINVNVAKSPKFCTLIGNRGRRIERRCLNLHLMYMNNRFCACAVQILLTVAGNATKCSTFEVQYGKSTSTGTTTIRHFRATLTERVISRKLIYGF